jgi:hypothetical protein
MGKTHKELCNVPGCSAARHRTPSKAYPRCYQHVVEQRHKAEAKRSRQARVPLVVNREPTSAIPLVLIDVARNCLYRVTAVREIWQGAPDDLNPHVLPLLQHGGCRVVMITDFGIG